MPDMTLAIQIKAVDAASNIIKSVASALGGSLGGALAGAGIAAAGFAVGIGGQAVQASSDFQAAMLSNVAHAGLAQSQFNAVSQSVLQMASAVGRSPTQLADAMYPILSAFSGVTNQSAKSAISLQTLKDSFETVAGTTVDGTAVANAAVGTFNALGLATNNVSTNTQRMNGLFDVLDKTVQLGNMQWDAYKNVVSKLAVAIQGTGISFNESQAALATMTNEGFSAQRASTYLSNTFTTLAIKTDALAARAKKLKISFDEQKYSSMDLAGKIEYLNQITDGNKQKLLALMGNNSTALKTFNALSIGIDSYRSNLVSLNHAQGTLAGSFDIASKGFNFQMQQMKAAGDALMITLGTALLPVVSQLAAAIVPLIGQLTDWITKSSVLQTFASGLTTAFKQMGDAFQVVTTPIKDMQQATQPLLDTFDRATALIQPIPQVLNPMLDSFDRATAVIKPIPTVVDPMLDTFDRATAAFPKVTQTVNPFVDAFRKLKPIVADVAAIFKEVGAILPPLVAHVQTFAGGILTAAWQSGAFQATIRAIKDILPSVGTFLQNVGTAINQNLLPPLESLVTNVGGAIANFMTWLDTSGTAKAALQDLAGMIDFTSGVLGTLIGWVAALVGWLGGGGAGTYTLVGVLTVLAGAFLALKIAETTAQFAGFISKLQEGDGVITNLASSVQTKLVKAFNDFLSNQAPNFKKMMDDFRVSSQNASTAAASVGTSAETAAVEVTAASTTMEADMAGVTTTAGEAAVATEGIGASAGTAATALGGLSLAAAGWGAAMAAGVAALAAELYVVKGIVVDQAPSIEADLAKKGVNINYKGGKGWSTATQQVKQDTQDMQQSVSWSVTTMSGNVVKAMDQMNTKAYTDTSAFTSNAIAMFQRMGDYGTQTMQSLDKNTIGYWNDIAAYIANHPINATIQTSISGDKQSTSAAVRHFNGSRGLQTNLGAYASGGTNLPAGWALVGEKGPELMYVPGGSNIYPLTGGSSIGGSSRSGGGGGGNTLVLNVNITARPQDEQEMEQIARYAVAYFGDQIRAQWGNV
jgi:TP901 family phage tail tape measure protein